MKVRNNILICVISGESKSFFLSILGPVLPYLRAADLGFSGQDAFRARTFGLTYTGSQLTFMTQNEKVIIFRDLLTRGHN